MSGYFEVKMGGALLPPRVLQAVTEVHLDQRFMLPAQLDLTVFGVGPALANTVGLVVGAVLEFTTVKDGSRRTLFTGPITALEFDQSVTGTFCMARAFDALHALTSGRQTRTFMQQKVSDIITKVLGEAGVAYEVSATSMVHEHVVQMDENDYEFISRLALDAGMVIRVDGKRVVVEPVPAASSAPTSRHGLTTAPTPMELTVDGNVISWRGRATQTESVADVVVTGWDPVAQKEVQAKGKPANSLVSNGAKPVAKGTLHVPSPVTTTAGAQEVLKGYVEAIGNLRTELSVEALGSPAITAGKAVTFGNAGTPFDGKYVVTHAVHRFDRDGYTTEVECTSTADRSLLGTISGAIEQPRPRLDGVVVAVVTNVQDPKKQGRVKVKYPWLPTTPESGWARVLHLGAGQKKQGLLILPAVNDEVMVGFEHGSPDHPVVIGGTYNGKDLPSVPGYAGSEVSGHVWRSGAGHEIALLDEAGKEKIVVTSGDKDVVITIDKAAKAVSVVTKQSKVDVTAGGSVTVDSKQDVTLKGTNVTIEAKAAIKLKGATAELSASGPVTVKGAIIKLN